MAKELNTVKHLRRDLSKLKTVDEVIIYLADNGYGQGIRFDGDYRYPEINMYTFPFSFISIKEMLQKKGR